MELVPDDVDRNISTEQIGDKVVQPLAFIGLVGVVIVDDKRDGPRGTWGGVVDVECLLRPQEGIVDVVGTEDVVIWAAAQAIGLRGIEDDLIDHDQGGERIGGTTERPIHFAQRAGHVEDMIVEAGPQDFLIRGTVRER